MFPAPLTIGTEAASRWPRIPGLPRPFRCPAPEWLGTKHDESVLSRLAREILSARATRANLVRLVDSVSGRGAGTKLEARRTRPPRWCCGKGASTLRDGHRPSLNHKSFGLTITTNRSKAPARPAAREGIGGSRQHCFAVCPSARNLVRKELRPGGPFFRLPSRLWAISLRRRTHVPCGISLSGTARG
jgi:hypothetical protein